MTNQPQTGDIRRFSIDTKRREPRATLARSNVLGFDAMAMETGGTLTCTADGAAESAYLLLEGAAHLVDGRGATLAVLGAFDGVHVPRGAECSLEAATGDALVLAITALDPRPAPERTFARQAMPRVIRYESPDLGDKLIEVPYLVRQTDMLALSVEKVRNGGGDGRVHAHTGTDSVWYALCGGRARFRFPDGSEAVVGAGEGLYLPRMAAYGFAAVDHEPAELLHVKVRDLSVPNERIDY